MIFNEITIICGIIVLLLSVVTPLCSAVFRFKRDLRQLAQNNNNLTNEETAYHSQVYHVNKGNKQDNVCNAAIHTNGITILVTAHQQAKELAQHLPVLLTQQYNGAYQVVVVAEQGDRETEEVLKQFANYPHLYTTFIPLSSRYMSRKKLAITLGVKAAQYEWIILTEANCKPSSTYWLQTMAQYCTNNAQLVLGYSQYNQQTPILYQIQQLYDELYLLHQAHHGTAYRTNSCNIAFRKSSFIKNDGYRGNLQLLRGEYDLLVNKYAKNKANPICIHPNAWMIQDTPPKKTWRNKQLYYLASRPLLKRSAHIHLLANTDTTMLYLFYISILAILSYAICYYNYILIAACIISLLLNIGMRIWIAKVPMQYFLPQISVWRIISYEPTIIWRNLCYKIRYRKADINEFTSHKL